jgi:hypothetical protein
MQIAAKLDAGDAELQQNDAAQELLLLNVCSSDVPQASVSRSD